MDITNEILCITKDWLYYSFMKDGKKETIKKPNTLTLEKIRTQLKGMGFNSIYESFGGKNATNETLENAKIPPFVPTFYSKVIVNEILPTPQEIINEYLSRYCEEVQNSKINLKLYRMKSQYRENGYYFYFTYEQLAGRICRAYNSYVRELDLELRLSQRKDLKSIYSFKWDYEEGVDILVIHNNSLKGIACSQDSERGKYYYEKKHTTRRRDKISVFKFPISWTNRIVIDDTWLYSDKAVEDLIENKIKGEEKNE